MNFEKIKSINRDWLKYPYILDLWELTTEYLMLDDDLKNATRVSQLVDEIQTICEKVSK